MTETEKILSIFSTDFANEILRYSTVKNFMGGTEILREGQYVKLIPLVVSGLVKV